MEKKINETALKNILKFPSAQKTYKEVYDAFSESIKDPDTFYSKNLLKWNGSIIDGNETISQYIAEMILKEVDDIENSFLYKIKPVRIYDNKGSKYYNYNVGHTGVISNKESSDREEEHYAVALYNTLASPLGTAFPWIIDYQTPIRREYKLNNKNKDLSRNTGKIDLLGADESCKEIYVFEFKKPDSEESLLRCALESFTYFMQVDENKLINDFFSTSKHYCANNDLNNTMVVRTPCMEGYKVFPAVLVFENSRQHLQYESEYYSNVRELMKRLGIKMFIVRNHACMEDESDSIKWNIEDIRYYIIEPLMFEKTTRSMDKFTREILNIIKNRFTEVEGIKAYQNTTEAREFYLKKLDENFYSEMSNKVYDAYSDGSGSEISSGKMNSLRSSSAMTYNLLWNETAKIINSSGRIGNGTYSVEFEKKYHTLSPLVSKNPANLDAFLYNPESCEAIACEMKMTEWIFNKPGNLKALYLDCNSYINAEDGNVFVSVAKSLVRNSYYFGLNMDKNEYPPFTSRYDTFQMFKHAVACYTACMTEEERKIKKLTLLNCVWNIPDIDLFCETTKERVRSAHQTELDEFNQFNECMNPVKLLFESKGIDFDICFMDVADFVKMLEKSEDELRYLKRYI